MTDKSPALVVFPGVSAFAESASGRRTGVVAATSELGHQAVVALRPGEAGRPDGDVVVLDLLRLRVGDLEVADLQDLASDVVDAVVASEPAVGSSNAGQESHNGFEPMTKTKCVDPLTT